MPTWQYNFLTKFYLRISFFKSRIWNCTVFKNPLDKFFVFSNLSIVRNHFHKTAEFQDISPRLTLEKETNRWKIAKKIGFFCAYSLTWQQSAIYSYKRKWNPRCVANLHCKYQELKPKFETNTSFLVLHPSSGVDTAKTVGSHLKAQVMFFLLPMLCLHDYHPAVASCCQNKFIDLKGG